MLPAMPVDWSPLRDVLDAGSRVVVTSHARPDADALGSSLALVHLLEARGKEVTIVMPSDVPPNLAFLDPDSRAFTIGRGVDAQRVENHDVHLVVDTSSFAQLGDVGPVFRRSPAAKAVIDHHESSDALDALVLRDTTAEAAAVLVVEMADAFGWDLPAKAVTPLFAALATDTGWFRHSNTKPSTLRLAARLQEAGADPTELYRKLYEEQPVERLRTLGLGMRRATTICGGKVAYTAVGKADFAETGGRPADTEGLSNQCLKIAGTEAAFLAVEQPDGRVKLSLRSRGKVDVAALAGTFGGGGHRQAAGAMLTGETLESAVAKVSAAFCAALG